MDSVSVGQVVRLMSADGKRVVRIAALVRLVGAEAKVYGWPGTVPASRLLPLKGGAELMGGAWLPEGVTVRADWADQDAARVGCAITGPAPVLSRLCARLGFRNDCRKGSVYITGAKVRWLSAADRSPRVSMIASGPNALPTDNASKEPHMLTAAEFEESAEDLRKMAHTFEAEGRPAEDIALLFRGAEIAVRRAARLSAPAHPAA